MSTVARATSGTAARADRTLSPIAADERVVLLDVIRGFTLYGVLLANTVPWYSGWALLPKAETAARTGISEEIALAFLTVFISRKSQTLLTCLFGLGFAMQLVRAEARGEQGTWLFLRRLAGLLLIGAAHAAFVWWGDVLWGYALTGGTLLLFRTRSTLALVVLAIALVFVPKFVVLVPAVSAFLDSINLSPADRAAFDAELLGVIRGQDYVGLVRMQLQRAFFQFGRHAPEYLPWMIGHFLLGFAAGRSHVLERAATHLRAWRKILAWGVALGLAGGAASAVKGYFVRHGWTPSTRWKAALVVPEEVAILAMASAYVAALALLMQSPKWQRRLILLAPAGQMALTTYLSQSVIMTFLFYGWGLGLIGTCGPATCIAMTVAVFAVQLALARVWLARFRFGPMEWVWRTITYGKAPPLRRWA
jgi:uncharacterized protein